MYIVARVLHATKFLSNGNGNLLKYTILAKKQLNFCRPVLIKPQSNFKVKQVQKCFKINFSMTERRLIPPFLVIIIRPLIRIVALLSGKKFKLWYAKRTPNEKAKFWRWFHEKRYVLASCLAAYFLSLTVFYISHLEYDHLTKRSYFILLNKEQQKKLAKLTFDTHLEDFKPMLLPKTDRTYARLLKITSNLIDSNQDIPNFKDKTWTLTVVNSPAQNAYVLPGGNIFVFSGMLQMAENDDQLAIVLAHEIAHAVLNHSFEQISRGIVVELLLALPIAVIWAIVPDLLAGFLSILGQSIVDVFHTLPYSRSLENEADTIGLLLAAKACVDIREAVVFWGTMRTLSELKNENLSIPWLSTHPDHGDREMRINELLTEIIRLRKSFGCPALSNADPRTSFYRRSKDEQRVLLERRGMMSP